MPEKPFEFTPPPASSAKRVVLSSDDPLWIARCTREDIRSLIMHPYRWIDAFNTANSEFPIELSPNFLMQISLVDRPVGVTPPGAGAQVADLLQAEQEQPKLSDQYLVQGISGTGVLIVLPPHNPNTSNALELWDEYWDDWEKEDPIEAPAGGNGIVALDAAVAANNAAPPTPFQLKVAKVEEFRQGFGHMDISERDISPEERADRIAAFIMLAADGRQTSLRADGIESPYLNRVLLKTPHLLRTVPTQGDPVDITDRSLIGKQFKELSPNEISSIRFSYMGRSSDFPDRNNEFAAVVPACDDKNGTLHEHDIVVNGVTIKSYE